jgi:hypothetical protein
MLFFNEIGINMTIETTAHSMENLFAQLGLPCEILLEEAPFWTPAQSTFLKEEILMDADWAAVIEQLNEAIHASYAEPTLN